MFVNKEWSGTKKDLLKKAQKLEDSIKNLVKKHREQEKEKESIKKLLKSVDLINDWLGSNEPKIGVQGKEI